MSFSLRVSRFDFDSIAGSYDRWYDTTIGALYDRIEKRAVSEFLPSPSGGIHLLEVGSGTGHWSRFFAGEGFLVTGLDCSPAMVSVARGKGIEGAGFLVADAAEIPFPSASFDVVAGITVLEFVADLHPVLEEMARCTRPGGVLVLGALNRNSLLGLRRRLRRTPIFANAEMPTVGSIREWLAPYGKPRVRAVAFTWPRFAARPLEWLGQGARLPWGDFIVAACCVDK
ncbi:MAG: methyltransferase domain-containing protein [Candidatus Eisenbacteria sp.]|nr:methyltransferase domain-containing protein [Candidatus Eisenbacteria bacterium]